MSDVVNIEFLDLRDLEENEKIRVRASLECDDDESVELPWSRIKNKVEHKGIKPVKNEVKQKISVKYHENYEYTNATGSSPVANNVYINQDHQFHPPPVVISPLVTSYAAHHQTSPVYYPNDLAPLPVTYPQQVYHVLPQTNINNVVHNYPNTTYPYSVAPQPIHMHNNVTNSNVGLVQTVPHQPNYENSIEKQQSETIKTETQTVELPTTSAITSTPVPPMTNNNHQIIVNEDTTSQTPPEFSVVQNGMTATPTEEAKSSPPPPNKSWASLFKSDKSNNDVGSQIPNEGSKETVLHKAVNNDSNKNGPICPIRYPKQSYFVDPDCYRMGEFLTSYSVDGKTISLQPRGLINQSNYCYINSILQALVACPPFYNLLSGLSHNITSNEKRKPTPVIDGMCRFVKEFKHLPANMRVNNRRSNGKNQKKDQGIMINTDIPFAPSWIYKLLNGIQTDLIEGRQEDAEEFLGCLLNGLNDEMLELIKLVKNDEDPEQTSKNGTEDESDSDKEWQVMGPRNKGSVTRRTEFAKTPISNIFGGNLKSRIHRTGDLITEHIQPFFTLQLNTKKVKTVQEALEALVTKNQLEGLTSSKTNEEVEAWQQVILDELPVILILHLKCFDFKLNGCTKIIKALEFPIDLKIDAKLLSPKNLSQKERQYKLFAVVYHDGKEASKGHYVTDAFHVGYSSWLRYDDASVKPVQEEHVLKPQGTRVPYLLFYRRSDTIRSK